MMSKQNRRLIKPMFAFIIGAYMSPALANTVDVKFKGTLLENPPCDVYSDKGINQSIQIDFQDIGINKINGIDHQRPFTVNIDCRSYTSRPSSLALSYSGDAANGFDANALQADVTGLGVRLYRNENGSVVAPNSHFTFNLPSNGFTALNFYAVPVKDPQVNLQEGPFEAIATIALQYP